MEFKDIVTTKSYRIVEKRGDNKWYYGSYLSDDDAYLGYFAEIGF